MPPPPQGPALAPAPPHAAQPIHEGICGRQWLEVWWEVCVYAVGSLQGGCSGNRTSQNRRCNDVLLQEKNRKSRACRAGSHPPGLEDSVQLAHAHRLAVHCGLAALGAGHRGGDVGAEVAEGAQSAPQPGMLHGALLAKLRQESEGGRVAGRKVSELACCRKGNSTSSKTCPFIYQSDFAGMQAGGWAGRHCSPACSPCGRRTAPPACT